MNHWIIVPVVLPALVAPFIVAAARHDIVLQRVFGDRRLGGPAGRGDRPVRARRRTARSAPMLLGDWPAPFGIVLVLDRLSALMLLLTGDPGGRGRRSTPPRAGTGAAAISTPCSSSSSWA